LHLKTTDLATTLILGLGNPLMADDGVGPRVIELLEAQPVPAGIAIRDGGTAGVGLVPEMEGYQRVILIDCAKMGLQPGEWRRFTLQEAKLLEDERAALSLHHASLRDALRLAEALGVLPPETIIYGVEPARVEWDRPMSTVVESALAAIAQAVLEEASN
jgi:hydrogenase maturation protease